MKDSNSFSILAIASYYGSENIVDFLLQHNVNVNQLDFVTNRSALHWAVAAKNYKISEMLVKSGAYVNNLDRYSVSPLILASKNDDIALVRLLIKHGANVNHKDRSNLSALSYACMLGYTNVAIELIVNGSKCTWSMAWNACSPLEYLLIKKQFKIVKYLIESGYDVSNEKWLNQFKDQTTSNTTNKNIDKNALDFVVKKARCPAKLACLCRKEIRATLGSVYLHEKLSKLNIAKHLIEYLKMNDL